jgi:SAM-dependent methyltransferase
MPTVVRGTHKPTLVRGTHKPTLVRDAEADPPHLIRRSISSRRRQPKFGLPRRPRDHRPWHRGRVGDEQQEFERLIDDAGDVALRGWDFSFLAGRTVSQPLPWDYLQLARGAAGRAGRVLDVDTGGGEVLASVAPPAGSIAVEPHLPNLAVATATLAPLGVEVRMRRDSRLPAADGEVDLVLNRHGAFDPDEAFRVLRAGGTLLTQQVGSRNDAEINAVFDVPLPESNALVSVDATVAAASKAGFQVERCEEAWPTTEYLDVGALVLQLRAVPWQVPDFDAEKYLEQLRLVHRHIGKHGSFTVTSHRLVLMAERPLIEPSPA